MQYELNKSYFRDSDDEIRYYTGLSTFATLMTLFKIVVCNISKPANQKLSNFQCFIITLMKLRLNLGFEDIGYRFSVFKLTVCRIFKQWIDYMNIRLKFLIHWPDRETIWKSLPSCIRDYKRAVWIIYCS